MNTREQWVFAGRALLALPRLCTFLSSFAFGGNQSLGVVGRPQASARPLQAWRGSDLWQGAWPWPCCAGTSPGCQGSECPRLPALWVRGHPWVPLLCSLGVLRQQDGTAWCSKPLILKVLLVPLPDPQLAALEVAVPEGGDLFRQEKICTQLSC